MAATKGKLTQTQQEQVRSAIRATQLVKRLQFFALGERDPANPDVDVIMSPEQIRSADIVLKKAVPDLKAVEMTGGEEDGSIAITFKTIYETR